MTEEKKGIERDISALAMDINNEPVYSFREFDEKIIEGQGYAKIPKEGSKYSMTLAQYCALQLERPMQDDKEDFADRKRRVMLARKLRKYGDKPISLKMDNWTYIKDRLMKHKNPPVPVTVIVQFDEIINGAITEKDLEDL